MPRFYIRTKSAGIFTTKDMDVDDIVIKEQVFSEFESPQGDVFIVRTSEIESITVIGGWKRSNIG